MSKTTPPEVLTTFTCALNQLIEEWEETLLPVLRGSLLLQHWFGDDARPAADIDFECFATQLPEADTENYYGGGYGRYGEFESAVDFGKAMCRYASQQFYYSGVQSPGGAESLQFQPTEDQSDGASLWTYGTPGERYYLGWNWNGRNLSGIMQIDIAQAGAYEAKDIGVEDIALQHFAGHVVKCPAYSQETLLAAKVSWLIRSFTRRTRGGETIAPAWTGEPKDLFDAHLLLTRGDLRADVFRRALLAFGAEDKLEWSNVQALFDVRDVEMTDEAFPDWWSEFYPKHSNLVEAGPVQILHGIVDALEPMLGDFYRRDEMPFLLSINADPVDESGYLIYADWLQEQGHSDRADFLRDFSTFFFTRANASQAKVRLQKQLKTVSEPWLCQVFGTSARWHEMKQRIARSQLELPL